MACNEIAALRLGMMQILGRENEAERQHDLAELGDAAHNPGPLKSLSEAKSLKELQSSYEQSLSHLEEKVASMNATDKELPYYRSLLITTKKVELELSNHIDSTTRLFKDLEEIHDFMHEVYPAN